MSGFIWLDVVDETVGGTIVDSTSSVKGVIKLTGDLGGTADAPKALKINGATVPASGTLTSGKVLTVSGSSSLAYITLDLTNATTFSGILPSNNLPNATTLAQGTIALAGDLGGTNTSPSVLKINGASVSSAGSLVTGNILKVSGGSALSYGALDLTNSNAVSGLLPLANQVSQIQILTQNITTANLQAIGASANGTFNIGSALPSSSRVLGAEINVTQILAGGLLSAALITVQSSVDTAGSLISSTSVLTTGLYSGIGTNKYCSRGGHQITANIILTGLLFNALTAGAITVNIFYAVA